jgi:hypothetical protein
MILESIRPLAEIPEIPRGNSRTSNGRPRKRPEIHGIPPSIAFPLSGDLEQGNSSSEAQAETPQALARVYYSGLLIRRRGPAEDSPKSPSGDFGDFFPSPMDKMTNPSSKSPLARAWSFAQRIERPRRRPVKERVRPICTQKTQFTLGKGTQRAPGTDRVRNTAVLEDLLQSFKSCRGHHSSKASSFVPRHGELALAEPVGRLTVPEAVCGPEFAR